MSADKSKSADTMPPLPEPEGQTDQERGYFMRQYTADQMRAFRAEGIAAAVQAERMAVDAAYEALQLSGEVTHYIGKARRILAAAIRARKDTHV